jgi:hypothetical protein
MLTRVRAFVLAVVLMVVLGSMAHSFFVQRAWSAAAGLAEGSAPVAIPLAARLAWAWHDLGGMLRSYAALTAAALLVGFLAAGALARVSGFRSWVFGAAGASAIFAMFTAMRLLLGSVGIFGARGPLGLSAQMAAGCLAGVLFARLTPPRRQTL